MDDEVVVVAPATNFAEPEIPLLQSDILGTLTCDTVEYGPESNAFWVVSSGSSPGTTNLST